jgi:hypothetical protein
MFENKTKIKEKMMHGYDLSLYEDNVSSSP